MRHAVQDLANGASHGDEVASQISWTQQDALAAIAAVAGLLNRI
jgi:hypothetical protein